MLLHSELTEAILGAAINVHRELGPGLLESAYEECLCVELDERGLKYQRQLDLPVFYKGRSISCNYRMDLVVEDTVVLEIKSVDKIHEIHKAQLLTYLKLSRKKIGMLVNFNTPLLKNGIVRMVL